MYYPAGLRVRNKGREEVPFEIRRGGLALNDQGTQNDPMALVAPAEALQAQGERGFGVKLQNVRAARSTSVEAFRLRSPQVRLPPAKDGAGFGEGVLQSTRQPTTVSFREPIPLVRCGKQRYTATSVSLR
jgi:hypothetical protein